MAPLSTMQESGDRGAEPVVAVRRVLWIPLWGSWLGVVQGARSLPCWAPHSSLATPELHAGGGMWTLYRQALPSRAPPGVLC